jgi:hypothetical protein
MIPRFKSLPSPAALVISQNHAARAHLPVPGTIKCRQRQPQLMLSVAGELVVFL